MRMILVVAILLLGASTLPSWGFPSSAATKRPLDLPAGGVSAPEDEDAGEVIFFLGEEFEGETFVWCVPNVKIT